MKEIKAPKKINPFERPSLFLAGSIEMGRAENWQDKLIRELSDLNGVVFNPRRDDWDASWEQSIENRKFCEQVSWELTAMEVASFIAMYFDPGTQSPITLLEFGLWVGRCPEKLVVFCPDGFWRKANIDLVCQKHGVKTCSSWLEFVTMIRLLIKLKKNYSWNTDYNYLKFKVIF